MPPIQFAHLLQVLALLLPAAVIGLVVAARLRRRPSGTFYRRLNGAGVFTCGQCNASWPAASRRDGLATARIQAAVDHAHRTLPAASPATPRAGAPTRPGSPDAPPQPTRKNRPMLRRLARLVFVVLVIASTALVLAVYAHNTASTP
jgi:hypothetical protein